MAANQRTLTTSTTDSGIDPKVQSHLAAENDKHAGGLLSASEQNEGFWLVDYLTPLFEDVVQISRRCIVGHLRDSLGQQEKGEQAGESAGLCDLRHSPL